ncbi:MAG: PKD domain-containing protein [Bacteroidales bacterium]|jgi:uncharacterized protein (TIGR02145 family)|nr:PKD domain-containing protein [Bacteroidales bacterium]MDY0369536.1 PKD domain-containing protein [Bacteroidales bacterium]
MKKIFHTSIPFLFLGLLVLLFNSCGKENNIDKPTADFIGNPTNGIAPLTVKFNDQSSNNPTTWNWDFGDGSISNEQNPSKTYTDAGTYTVKLTVLNSGGEDTQIKTDYITVTPSVNPPITDFIGSPTNGQAPLIVSFTDQSSNNPTSWYWDFGDGTTSNEQNPSKTYTDAGTYTITLTAINSGGEDTQIKTDYIIVTPLVNPPITDFIGSPTNGQAPLIVSFTDQSSNNPTSWYWDFGDGTTSSEQNPSKTYTDTGSFTVKLTAINSGGEDTQTKADYIVVTDDGTFTDDRDGTVYKYVTIGEQVWMAENLKYLPNVVGPVISSYSVPYYYVYDYHGNNVANAKATENYQTYGVLYNWPAAMVACPTGWHLPADEEWSLLTDYLGGEGVAGGKLKETGTIHWYTPNSGATNETGFTALPGGYRSYSSKFSYMISNGCWWSASEENTTNAWNRFIYYYSSVVEPNNDHKSLGLSVRCVRD